MNSEAKKEKKKASIYLSYYKEQIEILNSERNEVIDSLRT